MGAVTSIDSVTLGTLIAAFKLAHEHGGNLCITAASTDVRWVLDVTGTAEILMADGDDGDGVGCEDADTDSRAVSSVMANTVWAELGVGATGELSDRRTPRSADA